MSTACLCGALVLGTSQDAPAVLCSGCGIWWHSGCTKVNIIEISIDNWLCQKCVDAEAVQTQSQSQPYIIPHVECPVCHKNNLKGSRGLRIHYARMHKGVPLPTDTLIDIASSGNSNISFEEFIRVHRQNCKVLKRIPKGARHQAATKLCQLIAICIDRNSIQAWQNLFLFSYTALRIPQYKDSKISLTTTIKENINNFNTFDIPKHQQIKRHNNITKRIESKVADGDVRGAVRLLFSNDAFAPNTESTYESLHAKHPAPSRPLLFPQLHSDTNCIKVSTNDIITAIRSFPSGSAGGIDGLRPQILKDLISFSAGAAGTKLVDHLCGLTNFMLAGSVNDDFTKFLYGASLCALEKKTGGLRPIAVGNVFRRIASKIACRHISDSLISHFKPIQVGFAVPNGCEAAVHATRQFIQSSQNSQKIILKIDYKNAFNSVERDCMLNEIKIRCPNVFTYMYQCYHNPSYLFFNDKIIESKVGCQQGDPMGPAAFSLSIHPLISKLSSELNVWYLDDGTIGGDPSTVLSDLQSIISDSQALGLEINPSKCELFFPSEPRDDVILSFQNIAPGIRILNNNNINLLGTYLTDSGIPEALNEKFENFKLATSRLNDINSHIAFFLLKNCLAAPKFIYSLRTTPCWDSSILTDIDNHLKITLETITNNNLNNDQFTQASLPVKFSGLGMRKVSDLSVPAYLCSINSTKSLCSSILSKTSCNVDQFHREPEALALWKSVSSEDLPPMSPTSQKDWDHPIIKNIYNSLPRFSIIEEARLRASCVSEAGAWLRAIPSPYTGTLLDANSLRIAVALRLGCKVSSQHICICGDIADELGRHALCCQKSAGRIPRHYAINDILSRTITSANIPCILEPSGIVRSDGKRPDGMSLIPFKQGRALVWDATCVDTLCASHITTTHKKSGAAAESAARSKRNKYAEIIINHHFIPFAIETMGPWSEDALAFSRELSDKLRLVTGEPLSKEYFIQRVSLAVQRGNAASVLGTLRSSN